MPSQQVEFFACGKALALLIFTSSSSFASFVGTDLEFVGSSPWPANLISPIGQTLSEVNVPIYGPFQTGFSAQQDSILSALGCNPPSLGRIPGGYDIVTAEAMIANQCKVDLPRNGTNGVRIALDSCEQYTKNHFYERLKSLDKTTGGHSPAIARAVDGRYLYGQWEDAGTDTTPELDACGGHWGYTPESGAKLDYHYHVQSKPPFTFGCFGPNADNSLVTVEQCRALYPSIGYPGGCGGHTVDVSVLRDGVISSVSYDPWCPCFDAAGSNVGTAALPVFRSATSAAGPGPDYIPYTPKPHHNADLEWEFDSNGRRCGLHSKPPSNPSQPTAMPTQTNPEPTSFPSHPPTTHPSRNPTGNPVANPTRNPVANPTANPTGNPVANPTGNPTAQPTRSPSASSPTPRPNGVTAAMVQQIKDLIIQQFGLVSSSGAQCNDLVSPCHMSHAAGQLVRLAFHDAVGGGGPNGCLDFNVGAHGGLRDAVAGLASVFAQSQLITPLITLADLWVLAGNVAIELTTAEPIILPFRWGRRTASTCVDTNLLPGATLSWAQQRNFWSRLNMADDEIVALMGAHSLGRATPSETGFTGGWTFTQSSFGTNYFKVVRDFRFQFNGVVWNEMAADGSSRHSLMMLAVDIELFYKTASCTSFNPGLSGTSSCPRNSDTSSIIDSFLASQSQFYSVFARAWQKMTEFQVSGGLHGDLVG